MHILVTGGCGFIGSHTCLAMLKKGYCITIIDSNINSSSISIDKIKEIANDEKYYFKSKIKLIKGDIRDKNILNLIFENSTKAENPIKGVIHFAGLKSVPESIKYPLKYWDVNVNGTINLLNMMTKHNCKIIVFSSSATIYGNTNSLPIKESHTINPINPYGETKASVERILSDLYKSNVNIWKIANLRYFNPIGAHPSGKIGEDPAGEPNNLFPYISQVAIGKRSNLKIFGNNWPTPDGTGIRDYIHIMDLAEAHLAALECLINESPQILTLNIGTGKGTSVLNLVNEFENTNKCNINYIFEKRRKGDVANIYADNTLAKTRLKWIPTRTLKEICKDGWEWQTKNPDGYT